METSARDFAIRAHGKQKYGDRPYVEHLDQVWQVLIDYGFTQPEHQVGAYLHDVLEDCPDREGFYPWSVRIRHAFGWYASCVAQFCKDESGANRKERKAATYVRVRAELEHVPPAPWLPVAAVVKVADRLANVRNCVDTDNRTTLQMYFKESVAFREAMYVEGMCDDMWAEHDAAWAEYSKLVKQARHHAQRV